MNEYPTGFLPDNSHPNPDNQRQFIIEFWNELRACDETGETSWEVLEPLERQVTEALYRDPPDYGKANWVTALAMLLIAGESES